MRISFVNTVVAAIEALLSIALLKSTTEDIAKGIKECTRAMRTIYKELGKTTNIGEKQHLIAQLSTVKCFKQQFKQVQKRGAGHISRKETAYHRVHWDDLPGAFSSRIRTGTISNLKHKNPKEFMTDCLALLKRRISNALKEYEAVKVNAVFGAQFQLYKADRIMKEVKYFNTRNAAIYRDTNLEEWFDKNVTQPLLTKLDEFQEKDSGWTLTSIVNLGININKFTPQLGSSYIELPKPMKRKQACINVKNSDDACFAWSVVSALHPASKHSDRTTSYPNPRDVLNLKGINFPMTIKQIPRFEKQNDISVNIYILKKVNRRYLTLPTYLTKNKLKTHVNLLLIQDRYDDIDVEDNNAAADLVRFHYVWIKDLSSLLSSQLSKHNGKKYVCDRCLHYFISQEKLDMHYRDCVDINECKVRLPRDDQKLLKFKNFKNRETAPFIIYADLESVLEGRDSDNKYQRHLPAAIGYYVKCSYDPSLSFYQSYRGEDCMSWFSKQIENFAEDVETVFLCPYDISMTPEQQADFDKATHCHICEQPFQLGEKKVRDHTHLIPKENYRGAAHNSCNINYKDDVVIPVVFHNLSGYDAHFIIENVMNDLPGRVDVLPITKEKYISFTKHLEQNLVKFRFIDSFRFMNSALDTLASYVIEFLNLTSQFSDLDDLHLNLLTKKGIYPYDFIDSFDKFNHESLPGIEHFYNRLNKSHISNKQYQHAQRVWSEFNIKNLGEYTDLYMKTDILLLADIFEQFRSSSHETYGIDPARYYTLPGYTWDCMLLKTGQTLELLTDIDMLLFIERGIRGGLSQCSKRKSIANNKYIPKKFDSSKPENYLAYFDINNQYGWAMSQYLPYGGFEWVDTNIDITGVPNNSHVGYILEVDLEYPEYLHDTHKDLPFCPEHRAPSGSTDRKLLATLYHKERYVIHYRNLQQALKHGLRIQKIHRVLKFNQSPWMKTYIDLNTKLRQVAKNDFEKNLFKLMNNAVFGKTMENIRKRSIVKLISKWGGRYGAEALISKPEFKYATIFSENLIAVELNKMEIFFNKPIYVGMCILDISKTSIYDFHYEYMRPRFGDDCSVLYTDTDSLIYEVKEDIYKVIREHCHSRFDTSDYPPDNQYNIPLVNKKVLGMMKDEYAGTPIELFVGLRSKMYVVKNMLNDNDDGEVASSNINLTKKIKGVKKSVIKNEITLQDYLECVDNFKCKYISQNLIKSDKHKVFSVAQNKIALNPNDDKRYLIQGSYDTLPWGHYKVMED